MNELSDKLVIQQHKLKSWNWGAFFLGFIWGIGNGLPITLIELIMPPPVGFLWRIYIALKGNEWAWKKKDWESMEHFQLVQRKWAIGGFLFFLIILIPLIGWFAYQMLLQ